MPLSCEMRFKALNFPSQQHTGQVVHCLLLESVANHVAQNSTSITGWVKVSGYDIEELAS